MRISFLKLSALTACTLLLAATCQATVGSFEYDWVGGAPGYSGKIFLDAPTSAASPTGGTLADVLPASYLTTPFGNFSLFDQPVSSTFLNAVQWDQTHISVMFLIFDSPNPVTYPYYGGPTVALAQAGTFGVANGLEDGAINNGAFATLFSTDDFTGHWQVVAAPEPTSIALAGFGCMVFLVFRLRSFRCSVVSSR